MNYKGVCKTAPGTPSLLEIPQILRLVMETKENDEILIGTLILLLAYIPFCYVRHPLKKNGIHAL